MQPAPSASAAPALTENEATFAAGMRLVRRTGTYPKDRAMAVAGYAGATAGVLIVTIVLTALLASVSKLAASVVFLIGVVGVFLGLSFYVDRKLFSMRCAFAFLVTEVLVKGTVVPAQETTKAAESYLNGQYGDISAVVEVHNQVQRIVRQFFRTFDKLDQLLPIDLGPVRNALAFVVDRVAPRIADLSLSYCILRAPNELATASKDAVALVAQNPKAILGTAIRAHFTERFLGGLVGFVTFLIFGGAAFALAMGTATSAASGTGMPTEGAQTVGIFAAIFAGLFVGGPLAALASWFVRTAFLEPAALAMLLIRFHATTRGQAVDPSVRARLDSAAGDLGSAQKLANMFG